MKIEDLNLDVRTYNAVRRVGVTTVEELKQRLADDPDDLRRGIGSGTFETVEEVLAGMQEQTAVIVSENYTRAVTLTRNIIANAQAAQQSLYEVCKGLKAQITALTAERDTAKASLASKDKQFREALEGKDKQLKAAQDAKETAVSECKTFLNGKIHELEARIQELQDQPITHDMTDADAADEIMRLKRELEDERLKYTILEGGAEAKARRAADAVRQEYEKKLAEFQTAERSAAPDTKDVFKAYLANAADALTRLLTYLESIRDDKNLPLYISKVDGIVEMTQTRRNAL